jgi:hypothetical protein
MARHARSICTVRVTPLSGVRVTVHGPLFIAAPIVRKFPKGAAYVEMRDALTDELIGERGRYEFDSEISELLEQAAQCADDETTRQRVTTRRGKRSIETNRRALLLQRAAALYMCCHLPGGD